MKKTQISILSLFLVLFGLAVIITLFMMDLPWLKALVILLYGFFIPARQLLSHLQNRFVGMALRNKSIFLTPLFLPILLLISIPFWEYSRSSIASFDWTLIIMAGIIVIGTFLAIRSLKQITLHFNFSAWGILLLLSLGFFFGLVLGYWL
jgi:hypothetical protein